MGLGAEVSDPVTQIMKLAGGKKIVRECKRIGKMLLLAMDVNPTGALEKGQVFLRRAGRRSVDGSSDVLELVVKDQVSYMVDVPHIRRRASKMERIEFVREI